MAKERNDTLKEAKRLYDMGFAIHWLRPRSKIPLESGWGSGPRREWDYLCSTWNNSYNVGVRLGTPSRIGENYLAVIDVDVKSLDPRHKKEALDAARKLLLGKSCPIVTSGRGNGSRHYYVVTQRPFKTFNAAQSDEVVKFHSPSKDRISKKEKEELTEAELKQGIRLATAWEISLYSDGRQVVLPPSTHPDSGRAYTWMRPTESCLGLPALEFELPKESGTNPVQSRERGPQETIQDFEVTNVVLDWLGVPDSILLLIKRGLWKGATITNRSDYLLVATTGLLSAGCSRDDILTVLTEPDYFLGEVAYEHAKTRSRKRAAQWLWNYTVKKVMNEKDPKRVFADLPEAVELNETDTAAQQEELGEGGELGDNPEKRGYYSKGTKGALKPEYDALLKAFEKVRPYKMIADMKSVFVFDKTHYVDFTPFEIKAFAEEKFNPKPEERLRSEFWHKVQANHVTRQGFFIESTEGKINFKNGVLDLTTEKLGPHSPSYGFRGVLPYGYDPKARCPVFWKWLQSIMVDDRELIAILQEYMGYVVRGGEYKYHKALWLSGVGRNGKSTFVDMLKALIGAGNFSVISIRALVGDKFAGSDLDGKIANFSEETSPEELRDSGPFKNLTGDGDISAQKKFGSLYTFRNRAKLIMTYNQIPDLKDLSPGMLSRPLIVPFKKIIEEGEQDRNIKQKLFEELPGIFNFALRGWKRLETQEGFTSSRASSLALKNVREESCGVHQWVAARLVFAEPNEEGRDFLSHELYDLYCKTEKFPFKLKDFGRRLTAYPGMEERKKRTKRGQKYCGIIVQ